MWIPFLGYYCKPAYHTFIVWVLFLGCFCSLEYLIFCLWCTLRPITIYRTFFFFLGGGGVHGSCVECHLLFSLVSPIVSCSMINSVILGCLWPLVFVLNNILTLGIWRSAISHLPGCFAPEPFFFRISDPLWCIGPLYVTSSYSTRIFCRGVSGFATDCPCGVWCRGLATCLLYVCPLFGNRFLNNSWAVGLT